MVRRTKKSIRKNLKLSFWITLAVGVTFAYFLYLSWLKLTAIIGNSTLVWFITGAIVVIAIITGFFSFNKITDKFTK